MYAEYSLINECGDGHVVEERSEVLPHRRVAILLHAVGVETVHLCAICNNASEKEQKIQSK